MTPAAVALLAAFLVAAVADWGAVAARERGRPALPRRIRWLTKPLPLVLLIAAAIVLDPGDPAVRAWFVVGLALSLAGDVALLSERGFVAGLAAFLLAHVAYTAGFVAGGLTFPALAAGTVAMVVFDIVTGRRLVRALRGSGRLGLVPPVVAYMLAISAMVATAVGSLHAAAIAGAILFAASDTLLAEGRFVRSIRSGDLAVMVLYHLGQGLLVVSLALPAR
jgi:uncharacterized membrane protein YhhN